MSRPKVLILHAPGTNRDREAALAFDTAGAEPEIVPVNLLRTGERHWEDYQILVIPGGFSYADALGAGKLLAVDLQTYFAEQATAFVESGKPVLGICNGFQALVKAGILPGIARRRGADDHQATLTFNANGHFECRWIVLKPVSQHCLWTKGLEELIECPVAHGEGRFLPANPGLLHRLKDGDQIALLYASADGQPAHGAYPANPNGSEGDIAGICNPQGNVLGLMPHPEDHIFPYQHPRWTRHLQHGSGLPLFANGVQSVRDS
jgi:phosphoribosylformylglycinamidine synthase